MNEVIDWRPPIRRGEVAQLVLDSPPGRLVIADGSFQQDLSVGHAEIRSALEAGWAVWGIASMGAIRAYEMRDLGMRGFGRVYGRFVSERDFRDDEVALLHGPEPPYEAFSEPLIHIRTALDDLANRQVISMEASIRIQHSFASRWFGERTLDLLRSLVLESVGPDREMIIERWLAGFESYRIKTLDLADFLAKEVRVRAPL